MGEYFAIITVSTTGIIPTTYTWQGPWKPAHRSVTRDEAFYEILGKAILRFGLPGPSDLIVLFFYLEPNAL